MKKIFLVLTMFALFQMVAISQNAVNNSKANKLSEIATIRYGGSVLVFKPELNIGVNDVFTRYKEYFGLTANDEMRLIKTETDEFGFVQYRYQQHHNNILVADGVFILHSKDGKLKSGSGKIVKDISLSPSTQLTSNEAIQTAIAFVGASQYAWENTEMENDLKTMRNDKKATYYPQAELMYFNKNENKIGNEYQLVYKMEVLALKPFSRYFIYVNARNGGIYHKTNMLMQVDKKVNAVTRYNGIREITMDSVNATQYILRETGRGNGITTKNLQNNGSMTDPQVSTAINIESNSDYFSSDPVAANAHWASEMTYDYYLEKHNRNSYNNNGVAMMSYVHWGQNIANAMWTGSAMVYGDGDASSSPFTTAEICGHEITHAVTQYTANLNYEYESGALNEAFSDIFGAMVNLFATDTLNWLIGANTGTAFRNMANPKANQNPDTYKGQYWVANSSDNGGVHTNSGVGNYWFYLINQGDTGTNDKGYQYDITGIGSLKAEKIAYRALSSYLTPSSQFIDAYAAMIEASNDIHGDCSEESFVVAAAWAAVGVGHPFDSLAVYIPSIISPVSACGLTDEDVKVNLLYNGCNRSLVSGTEINFKVRVDMNTFYYDTLFLSSDFAGGENLELTLNDQINLSSLGNHRIDIWIKPSNLTNYSDSLMGYIITNRLQQNFDLGAVGVLSPQSSCNLGTDELITMSFSFFGCDSLASGQSVRLGYINNQADTVFEMHTLVNTIFPGDEITHTFTTPCDFTLASLNNLKTFTINATDTLYTNNAASAVIKRPAYANGHNPFTFSETDIENYYYKSIGDFGKVKIKPMSGYADGKVMNFTSGNVFSYYDQLEMPSSGNQWDVNEMLSAKAIFCVDATTVESLHLSFVLKQTNGSVLYSQYLGPGDYSMASVMRVLINGQQYNNETFKPTTPSADPYATHILNLSQYLGHILEITFETRNIAADTLGFTLDNAYLDNLHFIINSGDKIDEVEKNSAIALYPNPTTGVVSVVVSNDIQEASIIEVYDVSGRRIYKQAALLFNGQNVIQLNLENTSDGIYLVKVQTPSAEFREKLIIKR